MTAIFKIKEWVKRSETQFYMVAPYHAIRKLDDVAFFSIEHPAAEFSKIWYAGRKGSLLEFMSDYINVQIEVRKSNIKELPEMEFNPDNYEIIYVPIITIGRR